MLPSVTTTTPPNTLLRASRMTRRSEGATLCVAGAPVRAGAVPLGDTLHGRHASARTQGHAPGEDDSALSRSEVGGAVEHVLRHARRAYHAVLGEVHVRPSQGLPSLRRLHCLLKPRLLARHPGRPRRGVTRGQTRRLPPSAPGQRTCACARLHRPRRRRPRCCRWATPAGAARGGPRGVSGCEAQAGARREPPPQPPSPHLLCEVLRHGGTVHREDDGAESLLSHLVDGLQSAGVPVPVHVPHHIVRHHSALRQSRGLQRGGTQDGNPGLVRHGHGRRNGSLRRRGVGKGRRVSLIPPRQLGRM